MNHSISDVLQDFDGNGNSYMQVLENRFKSYQEIQKLVKRQDNHIIFLDDQGFEFYYVDIKRIENPVKFMNFLEHMEEKKWFSELHKYRVEELWREATDNTSREW